MANPSLKKHVLRTIVLSLFIMVTGMVAYTAWFSCYYQWYLPLIPIFFGLMSVISFAWITRAKNKGIKQFQLTYLSLSGAKLFLYLIIVLLFAWKLRGEVLVFVVPFLSTYLIFMLFDTKSLIQK